MGLIKSLVVGVFAVIFLSGCAGDGTFKHVLHDSDSLYTEERMMTMMTHCFAVSAARFTSMPPVSMSWSSSWR